MAAILRFTPWVKSCAARPSRKLRTIIIHAIIDNADWAAIERMMELRNITPQTYAPEEFAAKRMYFAANAIGGYPFVGTPDKIATELAGLSAAGVRGIAFSLIDYLGELPFFCAEVLPRLERMGAREAFARTG